jgi:hypothetical protein
VKSLVTGAIMLAAVVALIAAINAISATAPGWLILLLFFGGITLIVVLAFRALGLGTRKDAGMSRPLADVLAELVAQGQLATETFEATRCLAVEEFEDEGLTYWLQLADGRLLCLTGQYLYDYEAIDDDVEFNQVRRFPCTRFTVRWHAREGYTLDLICEGQMLEPEITVPPFGERARYGDWTPTDREVLLDDSFDALVARGGVPRAAG